MEDGDYVYFEYFTKETGTIGSGESLKIALSDNDDIRLYSFAPADESDGEYTGRRDLYMGVKLGQDRP